MLFLSRIRQSKLTCTSQTLKPRTPLARQCNAECGSELALMLARLAPVNLNRQHLMVQSSQRVVHLLEYHRLAKHNHQVVSQHRYRQCRLSRPEVAQTKAVHAKVHFELLDTVLVVCVATVQAQLTESPLRQISHSIRLSCVTTFSCLKKT
jgi:hypothetical protein